jgi:hypothetical protein
MALPVRKAMDLAKDMSEKGISGSISMGKPKSMPMGDDEAEADMPDEKDGIEACVSDIVDALTSGDKEKAVQCLMELVDRIKSDDAMSDQEAEPEAAE